MTLALDEAIEILRVLGSGEDPVYRRGIETTVDDLQYHSDFSRYARADKRVLSFYAKRRNGCKLVKGTLADMVLDRMGIKR